MTIARSSVVVEVVSGLYHCISRYVRRAFLCGFDAYIGSSMEYPRTDTVRGFGACEKVLTFIRYLYEIGLAISRSDEGNAEVRPKLPAIYAKPD